MSTSLVYFVAIMLALALFLFIHFVVVGAIIRLSRFQKSRKRSARYELQFQQLGVLYQLGDLQTRFDQQDLRVIFTIIGLICAPIGFFLILSPWTPDIGGLLVHAWGVIWALACLLPAIVSLTRRRLHVAVYTAGLIALKGEQRFIARWDQIEKFWKRIHIGRSADSSDFYEYEIQLTDGTSYRFTDNLTPAVSQLGQHIEQEVTRLLLPPAIATCAGGAQMSWDGLRVSPYLLSVDMDGSHTSLPVDEVDLVAMDEEQLTIFRKGQRSAWHKQRVETVANVAVLKGVLDHIVQEHVGSQLPQVIATYQAGTPIVFGRVMLTQQGIEVDQGKKRLSWDQVSTIALTDEQVNIQSRRDSLWSWQRLARWTVPNAALLKELAAYLLQELRQQVQS